MQLLETSIYTGTNERKKRVYTETTKSANLGVGKYSKYLAKGNVRNGNGMRGLV